MLLETVSGAPRVLKRDIISEARREWTAQDESFPNASLTTKKCFMKKSRERNGEGMEGEQIDEGNKSSLLHTY